MRRFYLERTVDVSGVSGTGKIAEGCQFDETSGKPGWCALVWLTDKSAMSYYPDIATLGSIHGHNGTTRIVWIDSESYNVVVRR